MRGLLWGVIALLLIVAALVVFLASVLESNPAVILSMILCSAVTGMCGLAVAYLGATGR